MKTNISAIAARLKELRSFSDISVKDMAERLGIDETLYASYEDGSDEAPINLIYKFAHLLDTEPGYILSGVMPGKSTAVVVEAGKGTDIKRYDGYSFRALAADFTGKTMNPMLVTIAPTDTPELVVHGGQEFNYVVSGELRVVVDNKEYFLREGDSIYFNPSLPHAQLAMGGKEAKFLTVINE
jgi:transcriptional regulator with XRE-family HTH domain